MMKEINSREMIIIENLLFDEIQFWKNTSKNKKYSTMIVNTKDIIDRLEDIYNTLNTDIKYIKPEYREIISELVENRLDGIEEDIAFKTSLVADACIMDFLEIIQTDYNNLYSKLNY